MEIMHEHQSGESERLEGGPREREFVRLSPPEHLTAGMEDVRIGGRPVSATPRRQPVWRPAPPAVAAVAVRRSPAPDPALLSSQQAAYNRLRSEMDQNLNMYRSLLSETNFLMRQLETASVVESDERPQLAEANARLRRECDALSGEIQRLRAQHARRSSSSLSPGHVRPQPEVEDPSEGPQWECGSCTFLNHPAISVCEQCEMPRIHIGRPALSPPGSLPSGHSGCYCHPSGGGGGSLADRVCSWPESNGRRGRGSHYRLGTL